MSRSNPHLPAIRRPGPPKVWKEVEVQGKEGTQSLKFVIQEIPEDRYEDILDHMTAYFIPDEPLCSILGGKHDPMFVKDLRNVWIMILKQGISVVAFIDNPNGGEPIIAGCNVLGIEYRDNKVSIKDFNIQSTLLERILTVVVNLAEEAHGYSKYGVDKIMFAFGLVVNPLFRGYKLGGHILSARENIGREYKILATLTTFTSPISQKLASRAGFETLVERDCVDIVDEDGKPVFPNIKVKSLKVMGKRLL